MLSHHIFRAYDIRGIYQEDFDKDGFEAIAKAYATYIKRKYPHRSSFTIALGRDGRTSGETLMHAFEKGLIDCGIGVVRIGMVMSPMLYFAVCAHGYDGGVMITASHNPAKYNGCKLQSAGAHSICGDEIQKIWEMIQKNDFDISPEKGGIIDIDVQEEYFSLLSEISSFPKTNWHIAIDAGNGIAGKYAPAFFRQHGFTVSELYCEVDGSFPNHEADPERAENLKDLKKLVIEKKCDFGLAFDGDGDRVGVVDNTGNHFSADLLLLLMVQSMLAKEENAGAAVVYDLKSTELLKEAIEEMGGKPVMCKTGHSFVEEAMQEHDAVLGGEVSGHIFIADRYFGYDDALLAAAKLVEIATQSDENFSSILAKLPKTFVTPEEKIAVEESKKFSLIQSIVSDLSQIYPDALTIDGIRIDFGEGAWGIVRASNTSAYLTTRFEARTQEKLEEIKALIMQVVQKWTQSSM